MRDGGGRRSRRGRRSREGGILLEARLGCEQEALCQWLKRAEVSSLAVGSLERSQQPVG
jgi:hypothetical protein